MNQRFHTLSEMAEEYRRNAAALEGRVAQLEQELNAVDGLETRRKLKHRIGMLHVLINEARKTEYYLAHYYDGSERAC